MLTEDQRVENYRRSLKPGTLTGPQRRRMKHKAGHQAALAARPSEALAQQLTGSHQTRLPRPGFEPKGSLQPSQALADAIMALFSPGKANPVRARQFGMKRWGRRGR